MRATSAAVAWPDTVDEIFGGDQAVALAHVTPASGVVLTPLTNFGIRDRQGGRLTPLNSSIGMWKKLERVQQNPHVAVAYHTRKHGFSDRAEYVLVQGRAAHSSLEDRGWLERHRESWERFAGPRDVGPLWERWLRIYHWRVGIEIAIERLIVWPNLACRGEFEVFGASLPSEPPAPQRAPTEPARGSTTPAPRKGQPVCQTYCSAGSVRTDSQSWCRSILQRPTSGGSSLRPQKASCLPVVAARVFLGTPSRATPTARTSAHTQAGSRWGPEGIESYTHRIPRPATTSPGRGSSTASAPGW
jgi:hypothetical protein